METEGIKRGIAVATNHNNPVPTDTITAAESLLGREFDIRTYDGAGKLLGMLGIQSVILQTDNRLKAEGLSKGGLIVSRRATHTSGSNGSSHHIEAKHRHEIYYGDRHQS
jgi:GTP cyclohydrolase II